MIFPLLIVGENWREQMAPFQGNNLTKITKEYLEFFDETPEMLRIYKEDSIERVQGPDGKLYSPLDPIFFAEDKNGKGRKKPRIPKKFKSVYLQLTEIYPTFEEYMRKYHGKDSPDPETGKYGYWWNPKSKWDWVNENGQFKDFLTLKDGTDAWQAKNGDIDWQGMKDSWMQEAEDRWNKYELEFARGQGDKKFLRNVFGIRPDDDRTSFLNRRSHISVWAVLRDGKWYQKGKNGWWGSITLPKDWEDNLEIFLQSLPEDTLISVVEVTSSEENERDAGI